jgi:hypothetical protein
MNMPRSVQRPRDPETERVEAVLAARRRFVATLRRSARGNLWREFGGLTVTVFKRGEGSYAWCIAGSDGKRYSQAPYEDEHEAAMSLASELDVC